MGMLFAFVVALVRGLGGRLRCRDDRPGSADVPPRRPGTVAHSIVEFLDNPGVVSLPPSPPTAIAEPVIVQRVRCSSCDAGFWRDQFERAGDERDALLAQLRRLGITPDWRPPVLVTVVAPSTIPARVAARPLPPCGEMAR